MDCICVKVKINFEQLRVVVYSESILGLQYQIDCLGYQLHLFCTVLNVTSAVQALRADHL